MGQQHVALVTDNPVVVNLKKKFFEKIQVKIKERDISEIRERIRTILAHAELMGSFELGFIASIPGGPEKNGKIRFTHHDPEFRYIKLVVQPNGNRTCMELFLVVPHTIPGDDFLKRIKEAQEALEPQGLPAPRQKRQLEITAEVESGEESQEISHTSLEAPPFAPSLDEPQGTRRKSHDKVISATRSSDELPLETRMANIHEAYVRRKQTIESECASINARLQQIAEALEQLAEEDGQLRSRLKELEVEQSDSDDIKKKMQELEDLLKTSR